VKTPRILLLPGWLDSGEMHWQTRWERQFGFTRVVQDDWQWPRRGDWMARLEEALLDDDRPAVLVAHSLGCHLTAAWAAHSQQRARVAGALLVAPPDVTRADLPPQLHNWAREVTQPLPFTSTVVLSTDDPFADAQRSLQMAAGWDSEVVTLGPAGHINGDSGLGDWPEGLSLLRAVIERAGLAPGFSAGV
jgi:predicted alpha/beta hydrolase family esterase